MRTLVPLMVAVLLCGVACGTSLAGEAKGKTMTLEGKIVCAKCSLHAEGQDACQNVLVVEKKGKQKHYYMARNDVYDEFGEVCKGSPTVRITGEVTKQDGQLWIAASKIEQSEDKG